MAGNTVEVNILGQAYTIKGEADAEYIQSLAELVDTRMKELYSRNPTINPLKASIMVSINLADQLYRSKKNQDDTAEMLAEKVQALSSLLEV